MIGESTNFADGPRLIAIQKQERVDKREHNMSL
jgi:hypothetical protein